MKHLIVLLGLLFSLQISFSQEPIDTDGNGYRNISTLEQLRWVSENDFSWSWNFELDNDIDASDTRNWNVGAGWTPIGVDNETSFEGKFNGNSFIIDSLYINRPQVDYIGLFSVTNNASIFNLNLLNCDITGRDYVGALSGSISDTLTEKIKIGGKIEGRNYIGGIAGKLSARSIENCSNYANISGYNYVGGIAGDIGTTSFKRNYNKGNISGNDYVGGIAGHSFAAMEECYSNSTITGNDYVGGISGEHEMMDNKDCFTRGKVKGNQFVGGLIGHNIGDVYHSYTYGKFSSAYCTAEIIGNKDVGALMGSANIWATNSYWDLETCGIDSSKGGFAKSTAEMKFRFTYSGYPWDFETIWDINPAINDGYPFLRNVPIDTNGILGPELLKPLKDTLVVIQPIEFEWSSMPYAVNYNLIISESLNFNSLIIDTLISSNSILIDGLSYNQKYNWKVRAIFESDTSHWSLPWDFATYHFRQCIYEAPTDTDSDGYLNISTLCHLEWLSEHIELWELDFELDNNINASDTRNWNDGQGFNPIGTSKNMFIGKMNGNNYVIDSLYINRPTQDYIGLFGFATVEIQNIGIINSEIIGNNFVGALVGMSISSKNINECYSKSNIQGNKYIGGLVGLNYSKIENSFSECDVKGNDEIGGLAGGNRYSIEKSYSKSEVKGNNFVGGLVGINYSIIEKSISICDVEGNDKVGGLIGFNISTNNVNECYSKSEVKGNFYIGGLVGLNYTRVENSFSMGSVVGIDTVGGLIGANIKSTGLVTKTYSSGHCIGNSNVGGLVGFQDDSSNVYSSFWDMEISDIDSSDGGYGKNTAEMKARKIYANYGWDFQTIWNIDGVTNDGYPFFRNGITSVENTRSYEKNDDILIFPNPASGYIEVSFINPTVNNMVEGHSPEIRIYNVIGELVLSTSVNFVDSSAGGGHFKIDISHLPKGTYYLKVDNMTKKFVKGE